MPSPGRACTWSRACGSPSAHDRAERAGDGGPAGLDPPAPRPTPGGGTANTAFLKVNADAVRLVATFQTTRVEPAGGGAPYRWLQYVQTVPPNFDELSWPHVTVGSLTSPM